jgi:hypothetical protein
VFHPILTVCQRIEERSTHSHSFCTQAQGFDYICAASDTAVDKDLEMLEDFRMMTPYFEKCEE